MTITLGGVDISDNMVLAGIESAVLTSSTQVRTLKGVSYVTINPLFGGRQFTLGTTSSGGSIMGIWCKSVIDEVKALEQTAASQVLNYRGDLYTVLITGNGGFTPFIANELEGPNKSYTGQFNLTEVG